jgi:hypothetical protein
MLPYTEGMLRAGDMARRVALFNWTVFGLVLLVSAVGPFFPDLRAVLLSAGAVGYAFGVLMIASGIAVWLVALLLVRRDPHLSAKAWSRWSISLLVFNILAGNLYVLLWWRRHRRARPPR